MQVYTHIAPLQEALHQARQQGNSIALVPTMGNLHRGHLDLIQAARQHCDFVLATIFVNPLQFGPNEDFSRYPRTLEDDKHKLIAEGCDALFTPGVEELYPHGKANHTLVYVPRLSTLHCGASRPGHFDGVTTVVCKLLNIAAADKAFFGLKDFQQLLLIRTMVKDLCIPTRIEAVPIARDDSGLALSSRNHYLSAREKTQAAHLYQGLCATRDKISSGQRDYRRLESEAKTTLSEAGLKVDYFNLCHAGTLAPAAAEDTELVILGAVYLGDTRLIDNLSLKID